MNEGIGIADLHDVAGPLDWEQRDRHTFCGITFVLMSERKPADPANPRGKAISLEGSLPDIKWSVIMDGDYALVKDSFYRFRGGASKLGGEEIPHSYSTNPNFGRF